MEISLNIENDWLIIDLNGRVDSFNYELVADQVTTLENMGKRKLAVELSDVVFLNLPSLRFFEGVAQRLKQKNGRLVYINPEEHLLDHIALFNRDGVISIVKEKKDLSENLLKETP